MVTSTGMLIARLINKAYLSPTHAVQVLSRLREVESNASARALNSGRHDRY